MERNIFIVLLVGLLISPLFSHASSQWEHQRMLGRYVGVAKRGEPSLYRDPSSRPTAHQEDTVLGRAVPGWAAQALTLTGKPCYTPSHTPHTHLGRSIGLSDCK